MKVDAASGASKQEMRAISDRSQGPSTQFCIPDESGTVIAGAEQEARSWPIIPQP